MGFESDSCFERGQQRTLSVWKAVEYAVTFNQLFDYRLTFSVCGEANTIPLTLLHITHHFSVHCLRELCYSLFFFFPERDRVTEVSYSHEFYERFAGKPH